MPFLDTNSHMTTKPYNLDIKCQCNSESYDQHGTKLRGGQNCLLLVGGFFNEREYSGADWLVPFLPKQYITHDLSLPKHDELAMTIRHPFLRWRVSSCCSTCACTCAQLWVPLKLVSDCQGNHSVCIQSKDC